MKVARILGVEVRLHWTFVVLVLVIVWANARSGKAAVAAGLIWIVAVFGSVLVHELAHSVVARRRGARVRDILLTPIGGISQIEAIPETPRDEFAIAIVGPLMSFVVAFVAGGLGFGFGMKPWPPALFAGSWFTRLTWLNILLGGFNMLPALPMDGGRVLRALLEHRRSHRDATRIAARVARFLAITMIIVGFFYDLWLVLIGLFVLLGAAAEDQASEAS